MNRLVLVFAVVALSISGCRNPSFFQIDHFTTGPAGFSQTVNGKKTAWIEVKVEEGSAKVLFWEKLVTVEGVKAWKGRIELDRVDLQFQSADASEQDGILRLKQGRNGAITETVKTSKGMKAVFSER